MFCVQRGEKKYAYTSISFYEPGKRYPKTVNEYLYVLDKEIRKIIPKKNRGSSQKILDDDTPEYELILPDDPRFADVP